MDTGEYTLRWAIKHSPIVSQDDADDAAHLLCADGTIFTVGKGGKAACTAEPRSQAIAYTVYV